MKSTNLIATLAACAMLPLGAFAQSGFPTPPPELSISTDYGMAVGGEPGLLEQGLSFADDDGPVMLMAQNTAPAPPPGGGNVMYMRQGPGGPGGPGDHFEMRAPGPHKWWKDSETVKQVGLSEGQATQIEQAWTDSKMRFIDLVAAVQKEELKLETLLNADQPNENAVTNQVDQVVQARGKLEKEHAMMMLNIRRLLTTDQWKKLQSMDGGMGMGMGHKMFVRRFHGPPPQGPPPDTQQAPQ
jgi:periplasmic protein CpxP/Spy